jgi:hypothetical protein
LRHNATASDIGEIATLTGTSGIVASATDVVEGVTLLNTDLTPITTDAHIFTSGSLVFEGATDDSYETTLAITDPTADRTFTFPDANGDVVLITATQTMSNKTITSPTINGGTFSGSFTGAMDITGIVLSGASPLVFEGATADDYETTLAFTDPTADRVITVPNATDTLVGKATTDTLSNKSYDLGGTGNTATGSLAEFNSALQGDSFVTLTGTETLTNKTLTSPTINAGTFSGTFTGTMDITGTVLSGASPLVFEGATADDYETTLTFTDPTADRTITIPNATDTLTGKATTDTLTNKSVDLGNNTFTGSLAEFNSALQSESFLSLTGSETSTNKTLTTPTVTSGVLNTTVSGSALTDEDNMSSDSATKLASQQSVKAYVDAQVTGEDLDVTSDSGTIAIDLDSETLTLAGGTGLSSSATGNAVTFVIGNTIATLAGSQTWTNKTFTNPTLDAFTLGSGETTGLQTTSSIIFEGATADDYETTLNVKEPTQDNIITIPNSTMTAVTTATHVNKASHIVKCIALG